MSGQFRMPFFLGRFYGVFLRTVPKGGARDFPGLGGWFHGFFVRLLHLRTNAPQGNAAGEDSNNLFIRSISLPILPWGLVILRVQVNLKTGSNVPRE